METRVGARQDRCMTICMLLEAPQATTGAVGPYGPPSIILFVQNSLSLSLSLTETP